MCRSYDRILVGSECFCCLLICIIIIVVALVVSGGGVNNIFLFGNDLTSTDFVYVRIIGHNLKFSCNATLVTVDLQTAYDTQCL
jgi:hypothetical protein